MTLPRMTKKLSLAFGPDAVRVCSQHHIKVLIATPHRTYGHDVWVRQDGTLKLRLHGSQKIYGKSKRIKSGRVIDRIKVWTPESADIAVAEKAATLVESIHRATTLIRYRKMDRAVFVDGSFRNGIAFVSLVAIDDTQSRAWAETFPVPDANNSFDAEVAAIQRAIQCSSDNPDMVVLSDSQSAVERMKDEANRHDVKVLWIPRSQNSAADSLAGRRTKSELARYKEKHPT